MSLEQPTALILLNMGGPDSLETIEPFLYNLFSDRELIQLPMGALLQKPFAKLISHFRSKKVRESYKYIGGRSPLLAWTRKQAVGIAERLGGHIQPFVLMRYWQPRAAEVMTQLKKAGIRQAIVLSMYPHYTGATTGSSINDFEQHAEKLYPELSYQVIDQWYDWPGYVTALASRVEEGLDNFHELMRDDVRILFSAHALPQKFIDRGDPYQQQVETTARLVMERVGNYRWSIAYQSRSGPVKWMTPGTDLELIRLGAEDVKSLLMVPISFVSDHIETLEEIDLQYRMLAEQHGIAHFFRAPSLNDHPDFLEGMAGLVRERCQI
ncbi:ferrochelatase [Geopsychrobacter electrodiphilus]|uniref:ferrochelatase n=1 Tax=Geopsychrobacter electrodiphilus TaxID=225196 RepID=UPI00037AFAC0|nr:ferrochelatase [Geopsychrobacter electrodiphilus]